MKGNRYSVHELAPFTPRNYHPGTVFPLLTEAGSCRAFPAPMLDAGKVLAVQSLRPSPGKPHDILQQEISAKCQKLSNTLRER
jgi:hypothetical protein